MRTNQPATIRRGRREAQPPELVIRLDDVEAPMRFDHPEMGAQERVNPEAAVHRILAAHRLVRGNSTHAARLLGVTYQGLRRAIIRFEQPRACADGVERRLRVDTGDGVVRTLDGAIQQLRAMATPNREANETEARALITSALAARVRLVDIARAMSIDASRLTKFRSQDGHLTPTEIDKLRQAARDLCAQPIVHRSGRRAAT
jgi:hypothetical protein